MSDAVRVSIIIPAYNEHASIGGVLKQIADAVTLPYEVLVVVDSQDDTTIAAVDGGVALNSHAQVVVQTYGRGPANAIRYGFDRAAAECVVVTMADGSDDVRLIDDLVRLVEGGCAVAAASRYMPGGAQRGGPLLKRIASESAGRSLQMFAGVGTHDATNSFKAYEAAFVRQVGIDSRSGFEVGIELVAKARRARRTVVEIPTVWLDRKTGESSFKMRAWLPQYLFWYQFAFGRAVSADDVGPIARGRMRESA